MATIGRHAAVAQLRRGPIFRGTIGWLAWLGLHLVYLVGFRNRLVVLSTGRGATWTGRRGRASSWPTSMRTSEGRAGTAGLGATV